ncbi:MAG: YceI family protein [Pontibacterium sp.]
MKKLLLSTLIAASAVSATANAADYVIDTKGAHASIEFRISHLGVSYVAGRFNTFEGEFSYDSKNAADASVEVTVETSSIDSNHAERDKHLRSGDFLDVAKFPTATFKSTSYTPASDTTGTLVGDLTLHGVTKPLTVEVSKVGEGKDPWGGYRAGFTGTGEIKLKDFGINYNLGPASETLYLDIIIEGIAK